MLLVAGLSLRLTQFGVNPAVAIPAASYLRILNWSTLPLLLYGGTRRYLQGVGQVRVITITYVLANLLNWGGNWVLIYGKLGFPALGVSGSAISTCIARVGMAVALLAFAWRYERRPSEPYYQTYWSRLRRLGDSAAPVWARLWYKILL